MNDTELVHGETLILPSWIIDELKKQEVLRG